MYLENMYLASKPTATSPNLLVNPGIHNKSNLCLLHTYIVAISSYKCGFMDPTLQTMIMAKLTTASASKCSILSNNIPPEYHDHDVH